jgi:hypothetical protein
MLVQGKEPAVSTCYSQPRIRDYGDLIALTASDFLGGAHVIAGVAPSLPATNHETSTSGGPLGVLGQTNGPQSTPNTPQSPGVLGTTQGPSATPIASTSSPTGVAGTSGGGGGGGGGGNELPFTGFAVALAAFVGSSLAGTGLALRKVLRRE